VLTALAGHCVCGCVASPALAGSTFPPCLFRRPGLRV